MLASLVPHALVSSINSPFVSPLRNINGRSFGWREHRIRSRPLIMHTRAELGNRKLSIMGDPWHILGVPQNASTKDIKRAHRALVKRYHPDARTGRDALSHENSERFLAIQRAYEILMGKHEGKDVSGRSDSWDFHDWFWSFSMKRRWRRKKHRTSEADLGGMNEERQGHIPRTHWQQQLQGLKARAAAKKMRQRRRSANVQSSGAYESDETNSARNSDSTGYKESREHQHERIWRSYTKNARVSNVQDDSTTFDRRMTLDADAKYARKSSQRRWSGSDHGEHVSKAKDLSEHMEERRGRTNGLKATVSPLASEAVVNSFSVKERGNGAVEDGEKWSMEPVKGLDGTQKCKNMDSNDTVPIHEEQKYAAQVHKNNISTWKSIKTLINQAAHVMRDAKRQHDIAFEQHFENIKGHISATMRLHVEEEFRIDNFSLSALHLKVASQSKEDNKSDQEVISSEAVSPGTTSSCAKSGDGLKREEYQHHGQERHNTMYDEHDRKFANRTAVQERLSTQLVGLRRRAALRRSFELEEDELRNC